MNSRYRAPFFNVLNNTTEHGATTQILVRTAGVFKGKSSQQRRPALLQRELPIIVHSSAIRKGCDNVGAKQKNALFYYLTSKTK